MRNITITAVISLLCLIGACKKECATCKNECYRCGSAQTLVCSSDYYSQANWLTAREFYSNSSGCNLVSPTESVDICDENLDDLITLYEKSNYYCSY